MVFIRNCINAIVKHWYNLHFLYKIREKSVQRIIIFIKKTAMKRTEMKIANICLWARIRTLTCVPGVADRSQWTPLCINKLSETTLDNGIVTVVGTKHTDTHARTPRHINKQWAVSHKTINLHDLLGNFYSCINVFYVYDQLSPKLFLSQRAFVSVFRLLKWRLLHIKQAERKREKDKMREKRKANLTSVLWNAQRTEKCLLAYDKMEVKRKN